MSAHTDRIRKLAHEVYLLGHRTLADEIQAECSAIEAEERAAPELLEALRAAVGLLETYVDDDFAMSLGHIVGSSVVNEARAAIRKATGEATD